MNQITQGSVISGVRFENYKGTYCSAIVITARCDLANKGKVGKVFYLCAIPLKEWVLSRKGIGIIAAKEIKEMPHNTQVQDSEFKSVKGRLTLPPQKGSEGKLTQA